MIVMKFGGTSVENAAAIERAASIVCGRLAQRPVVVVSAMAKVTDALLAMGRAAGAGNRDHALGLVQDDEVVGLESRQVAAEGSPVQAPPSRGR